VYHLLVLRGKKSISANEGQRGGKEIQGQKEGGEGEGRRKKEQKI